MRRTTENYRQESEVGNLFPKIKIKRHSYESVAGSRRVIKGKSDNNHFYSSDIWSEYAKRVEGIIPDGYVVYGELVGWVDETTPTQKNYTYDLPPGQMEFYVYRVATVNHHGVIGDLSWAGVKDFCASAGLKHVPEFHHGIEHYPFADNDDAVIGVVQDGYLDKNFAKERFEGAVPLSDPKSVDEGVCVRIEGQVPRIFKAKSPKFLEHETKQLDTGEASIDDYELVA